MVNQVSAEKPAKKFFKKTYFLPQLFNPIPIGLFLANIDGGEGVFHPSPFDFALKRECKTCP